jgi:hypothetical protein
MQNQVDKSQITKAFNKHFFEFIDDMLAIYPESKEIRVARNSFETFRSLNPISIIKVWYSFIYEPYKDVILEGNVDFFVNKDYYDDINGKSRHVDAIMEKIDRVKELVSSMSPENKAHSAKYILNLSRLSEVYYSDI